MLFLFTLVAFCMDLQKVVTNYEDAYSLIPPAVDENGRSYRYKFYDNYLIKTYSSHSTYVQLCFSNGASSGAMETHSPIPFTDLRADVKFKIVPSKVHGDGFGVFFSLKKFKKGTLLGRDSKFDGISVQILTKAKGPIMRLTFGDQVKEENLNDDIYKNWNVLRVENYNKTFRVLLGYGNEKPVQIFSVYNSNFQKNGYFSISGSNTVGSNLILIQDVKISSLVPINAKVPIRRSGGVWVWVVFVVGVVALGYYLLRKQIRKPESIL